MILGEGVLNWCRYERVGDRYGSVKLFETPDMDKPAHWPKDAPLGQHGTLIAEIIETRDSEHIGDLFRGLFPTRPNIDERITLGVGKLHIFDDKTGDGGIGVLPDKERYTDLLDPEALYTCHSQTVRLVFEVTPS